MKAAAPSVVLVYHRVAALGNDPQHLAVHPEHFADQLSAMATMADVVPLADVLRPSADPRVAITFDDGYADNRASALPALLDAGVPATMFVTTSVLDGRELWWDRLEDLVLHARAIGGWLRTRIGATPLAVDVRTADGRARAVRALSRRLRALPPGAIEAVLDDLHGQVEEVDACDRHAVLDRDDVHALAAAGIDIGAHTRHHANLGRLDARTCREEIEGSRDDLRAILGHAPTSFAYPFGMVGSFDRSTERLVRDAGFELACANVPGRPTGRDRFRLPRHIVPDVAGADLATLLAGWLAA